MISLRKLFSKTANMANASDRPRLPPLKLPEHHSIRIGIVCARFNTEITDALCDGAERVLRKYNIPFDVVRVAGSYEVVYACAELARAKKFTGLVALGCLIKGATIHFDIIAHAVSRGIMDVTLAHHLPIGFGIITANNEKQARARIWIGEHATIAVLDALSVVNQADSLL